MPPPGRVNTLEDYWVWIEQLIDSSGGFIPDDEVVSIMPVVEYDGGPWLTLNVELQPIALLRRLISGI